MRLQYFFSISVMFFTAFCLFITTELYAGEKQGDYFEKIIPPYALLDITLSVFEGEPEELAAYQGKFVLLNLWATWCAPCVEELPSLDKLQQKYKNDPRLEVVAVTVERGKRANIIEFMKRHKVKSLKAFWDETRNLQKQLKFEALPTTFLINPEGMVVASYAGSLDWADDIQVQKELEAWLATLSIENKKESPEPILNQKAKDNERKSEGVIDPSHIQRIDSMDVEIVL